MERNLSLGATLKKSVYWNERRPSRWTGIYSDSRRLRLLPLKFESESEEEEALSDLEVGIRPGRSVRGKKVSECHFLEQDIRRMCTPGLLRPLQSRTFPSPSQLVRVCAPYLRESHEKVPSYKPKFCLSLNPSTLSHARAHLLAQNSSGTPTYGQPALPHPVQH